MQQQDRLRAAAAPAVQPAALSTADVLARCSDASDLAPLLEGCRRCDAWCRATQPVPGHGSAHADIMVLGEQPGDREDLLGRPFQGPAGALLAEALRAAGVDPERLYLTNAVKHFNWRGNGKRRIHQRPSARQVSACALWLDAELALLRPRAILVLGGTAGQRLLGRQFRVETGRGKWVTRGAARLFPTVHPAAVLRSGGSERDDFFADIANFARTVDDGMSNTPQSPHGVHNLVLNPDLISNLDD